MAIKLKVLTPSAIEFGVAEDTPVVLKTDVEIIGQDADPYLGPYEFTPTNEVQIVDGVNKKMTENIVINAIPSNYGLINWNGSVLTVS